MTRGFVCHSGFARLFFVHLLSDSAIHGRDTLFSDLRTKLLYSSVRSSLHCDALLQCNSHQYQIQSIQLKQLLQQTNKCSNHHIRYPCPSTSSLHAEKRGNLAITYAEIGLALRTMVFGFPPQDPPTSVCCVPAEVARKGRPLSCLREKLIGETSRHLLTLGQ